MAAKPQAKNVTREQLHQMAEELLSLEPLRKRYDKIKDQVKAGLQQFKLSQYEIDGLGTVEIQGSERITVTPDLARKILGDLAKKIIQVEESVSNDLVKACVKMGDITEEQRQALLDGAEKTPIASLYVKPVK